MLKAKKTQKSPAHHPWVSGMAILEDNVFEVQQLPEGSLIAEKRKAARINVQVPLKYSIDRSKQEWETAKSLDISNSGVRIMMKQEVPVGTPIHLDVTLPDTTENIQVGGVVIWTHNKKFWNRETSQEDILFECGVAFENLRQVSKKDHIIRFFADRLCIIALKSKFTNLECYPVENFEELIQAYHLIYKEYVKRGYCEENKAELHYSFYCTLPGSRTFVLKRTDKLLGTLSILADSPCGLPMEHMFGPLIKSMRDSGRHVAEVSLLALDQEAFRGKRFSLTDFEKLTGSFKLFKLLFDYACHIAKVTDLLIAVHPKHTELYRYLKFQPVGPIRSYNAACGKPALPMRLKIKEEIENLSSNDILNQYFVRPTAEEHVLKKHIIWDPKALQKLLITAKPIWGTLPSHYQDYIVKSYPDFHPAP